MGSDFGIPNAKVSIGGVVSEAILTGPTLHLRDPLTAKSLIGEKRCGRGFPIRARQDRRKRHTILNRLVGALTEVRKHRMRGVTEQC